MKLSGKTNEPPQFSDKEEEIYFLKQVGRFTRKKRLAPDPLSGSKTEDIGHGISIYLCKMKPDGSEKTEIKELWHDVRYPIDTQAQSTWMDVNEKTRKVALAITLAGSDLTGIWTMSLDGNDLKRVMTPDVVDGHLRSYGSPSWTPDGEWLVFSEAWRGTNYCRIAKCDKQGGQRVYLTEGPVDGQPRVSPDGKQIAFIRWISKGKALDSWLWLMNLDGSDNHPVPNPEAKPNWSAQAHWGTYPAWSPDGERIYAISVGIVDADDGRMILDREPKLQGRPSTAGWAHWGNLGFVGYNVGGMKFTDSELREGKWIGSSKLAECSNETVDCRW